MQFILYSLLFLCYILYYNLRYFCKINIIQYGYKLSNEIIFFIIILQYYIVFYSYTYLKIPIISISKLINISLVILKKNLGHLILVFKSNA